MNSQNLLCKNNKKLKNLNFHLGFITELSGRIVNKKLIGKKHLATLIFIQTHLVNDYTLLT
jgi:hypothetical protein